MYDRTISNTKAKDDAWQSQVVQLCGAFGVGGGSGGRVFFILFIYFFDSASVALLRCVQAAAATEPPSEQPCGLHVGGYCGSKN